MRRLLPVVIVAVVLLAGCAKPGDGPRGTTTSSSSASPTSSSSTSSTAPPMPGPPAIDLLLGFDLTDCFGLALEHARPLDQIQALLPPGFNASAAPGSADPRGVVTIALYACGNFTISGATVPDTYLGLVSTFIQRPVERVPGAPEAPVQEYLFRVLAGEDVLAVLWPAAGYSTYNGSAALTLTNPAVGFDPVVQTATGQVGAAYAWTGAGAQVPGLPNSLQGPFARYTALADSSVLLWTGMQDLPNAATGSGQVRVADDDPVASLAVGVPGQAVLAGNVRVHGEGAFLAQDLRRVFTPAP